MASRSGVVLVELRVFDNPPDLGGDTAETGDLVGLGELQTFSGSNRPVVQTWPMPEA